VVEFPPKGPWDDLRRRVEEILDLPRGSTNPNQKFTSPVGPVKKVIGDIENFLKNLRGGE